MDGWMWGQQEGWMGGSRRDVSPPKVCRVLPPEPGTAAARLCQLSLPAKNICSAEPWQREGSCRGQSQPGKPKAALTPSGRGGEAQHQPRLVFSLRPAGLRAYLGGASFWSWFLRSSLLMT